MKILGKSLISIALLILALLLTWWSSVIIAYRELLPESISLLAAAAFGVALILGWYAVIKYLIQQIWKRQ